MADTVVQDAFRRIQAIKSRYPGHFSYGYSHKVGEKDPRTDVKTNEFSSVFKQRRSTEWRPVCQSESLRPSEIACYAIYHSHVGHIPNYGGHIPGAVFRFGKTFGHDTIDAKRWLKGDYRTN